MILPLFFFLFCFHFTYIFSVENVKVIRLQSILLIINIIRLSQIYVISFNSPSTNYSFQTNKFLDNLLAIKIK